MFEATAQFIALLIYTLFLIGLIAVTAMLLWWILDWMRGG